MASIEIAPTSVAIEAKSLGFQFYTSGIINSKGCGTELDHGVTAVGYGVENGQKYYLVKILGINPGVKMVTAGLLTTVMEMVSAESRCNLSVLLLTEFDF